MKRGEDFMPNDDPFYLTAADKRSRIPMQNLRISPGFRSSCLLPCDDEGKAWCLCVSLLAEALSLMQNKLHITCSLDVLLVSEM